MREDLHVYPLNDLRDHDTDSRYCECHPKIIGADGIVIHNSWDGREILERAQDEIESRMN